MIAPAVHSVFIAVLSLLPFFPFACAPRKVEAFYAHLSSIPEQQYIARLF